jgi:DnaK suppressor protein
MDQRDIERIKQKLELQRQQALQFLRCIEDEAESLDIDSPQDVVDQCVVSMSRESLFERSSQQRMSLRLIDDALKRITDGSFGVCTACGDDIPRRRLEALPWSQHCLRCQEILEAGGDSRCRVPRKTRAA